MNGPRVSVVMPVYNGQAYLAQAIESVLQQTLQDFELLVIDDGSTDRSVEIVRSYGDPRLRLLVNDENLGLVTTRNKALAHARGEFVASLDCDDVALPERLEKQSAFLAAHPDFGMVGSWIEIIDGEGATRGVMKYPGAPDEIPPLLLFGNYFSQSSVMIRKSSLPKFRYRPEYPVAEDYDLWVRMAEATKLWNLPQVLTKYRIHPPSTSFAKAELMESCIRGIVLDQLSSMGLAPSDSELELHRQLGTLRFPLSARILVEAERWLVKLIESNQASCRFDQGPLRKVVARRWFLFCREASGAGVTSWRRFHRADMSRWAEVTRWERFKFLVRCLIKWQRARREA